MHPAPIDGFLSRPVTLLRSTRSADNASLVSLGDYLGDVKRGRWQMAVEAVRSELERNPSAAERLKTRLPAIMPSGDFAGLRGDSLRNYSGIVCLDLDKLSEDKLAEVADCITKHPAVVAFHRSPSGRGLKVFVATAGNSAADHGACWKAAADSVLPPGFRHDLDLKTGDLPRRCFVSYDPDLWQAKAPRIPICPADVIQNHGCDTDHLSTSETRRGKRKEKRVISVSHLSGEAVRRGKDAVDTLPERLRSIYGQRIKGRDVASGARNEFITETIPALYEVVSEPVLCALLRHHFEHQGRHAWSTEWAAHEAAINASLKSYRRRYLETLPVSLRPSYEAMPERERATFRICRSLARCVGKSTGQFFLSCSELAARIGSAKRPLAGHSQTAERCLAKLQRGGLIVMIEKGRQYRAREKPLATEWRWVEPGG